MNLEICAPSFESALAAQEGGASRIELCSVLPVGGVTPSYGLITSVKDRLQIPVHVLIRPRGGDFLYSDDEGEEILRDIEICGRIGVDGVVIGALDENSKVDIRSCREWTDCARKAGLFVTFHRAIDRAADILEAMETVIALGCGRILTSGAHPNAFEGREVIRKMVDAAAGRIAIMAGAGVKTANMKEIVEYTGVRDIHFSASKSRPSGMKSLGGIAKPETLTHSDRPTIEEAARILFK